MSAEDVVKKTFRTVFSREGSIRKCELYYKGKLILVLEAKG